MMSTTLTELPNLLWKRKWQTVGFIGFFLCLSSAYTFFQKPVFLAQATLITTQALSPEPNLPMRFTGPGQQDPLLTIKGILESRDSLDYISTKTGQSRRALKSLIQVLTKIENGQITINCFNSDTKLALNVVKASIESLRITTNKSVFNSAGNNVINLKKAIDERTIELKSAEERLVRFQKSMKAPIVPGDLGSLSTIVRIKEERKLQLAETDSKIQALMQEANYDNETVMNLEKFNPKLFSLKRTIIDKEIELSKQSISLADKSPVIVELKALIESLRNQLKQELRNYRDSINSGTNEKILYLSIERDVTKAQVRYYDEMISIAPRESVEWSRISREIQQLSAALGELKVQYERARVKSTVEQIQWNVLSTPKLEDLPVNKSYLKSAAIGIAVGFLFSLIGLLRNENRSRSVAI